MPNTTLTESALDNILVHQKDTILRHINAERYETAVTELCIVKELWTESGYFYKFRELAHRMPDSFKLKLGELIYKHLDF